MDVALPAERQVGRNLPQHLAADVKLRAKVSLRDWTIKARQRFGRNFDVPSISFDLKGLSIAAQAWLGKNHVQLNAAALIDNESVFLSDVIPHELAHLLTHEMHGKVAPHGVEWQRVMRLLGVKPNVTYSLTFDSSKQGLGHRYVCGCQEITVSTRQHNKLMRSKGKRFLACKRCGRAFRLKGPAASASPDFGKSGDTRRPTEKMLAFAELVARRSAVALPVAVRSSFEQCAEFIEKHKGTSERTEVASGSLSGKQTPQLSSARTPATKPEHQSQGAAPQSGPTEAQLRYATSIASRRGKPIPADVLASKRLMSLWIDQNK